MKLYYSPGACSFAPHLALQEAGVAADAVKVDLRAHKTGDGADYYAVNPKGYVPFLVLDDGTTLSEAHVILQYIADRKPGTIAPGPSICTTTTPSNGAKSTCRRRAARAASWATRPRP